MTDYFKTTRAYLDEYNQIQEKIKTSSVETTDSEDIFLDSFIYLLTNGLMIDLGYNRQELTQMRDILTDALILRNH